MSPPLPGMDIRTHSIVPLSDLAGQGWWYLEHQHNVLHRPLLRKEGHSSLQRFMGGRGEVYYEDLCVLDDIVHGARLVPQVIPTVLSVSILLDHCVWELVLLPLIGGGTPLVQLSVPLPLRGGGDLDRVGGL